jgi:hypothetical protein
MRDAKRYGVMIQTWQYGTRVIDDWWLVIGDWSLLLVGCWSLMFDVWCLMLGIVLGTRMSQYVNSTVFLLVLVVAGRRSMNIIFKKCVTATWTCLFVVVDALRGYCPLVSIICFYLFMHKKSRRPSKSISLINNSYLHIIITTQHNQTATESNLLIALHISIHVWIKGKAETKKVGRCSPWCPDCNEWEHIIIINTSDERKRQSSSSANKH